MTKEKSIIKLFLDDTREPPDSTWAIVRSYDAFVEFITKFGIPDVISFDHDLGHEHYTLFADAEIDYDAYTEKTGYDCAKWLVENDYKLKEWTVHSLNPVGKKNIIQLLISYEVQCYVPEEGR